MKANGKQRAKSPLLTKKQKFTKLGMVYIQMANAMYFLVYSFNVVVVPQYLFNRMARESVFYDNITRADDMSSCNSNTTNPVYRARGIAQERAATWSLYFSMADYTIGVVMCLVLGSNSDRWGRKCLFVIPTATLVFKIVFYTANSFFLWPMWTLVIASLVNSFGGSYCVLYLGTALCAADLTGVNKSRSFYITLANAVVGLTHATTSFLSGYAITTLGYWPTFAIGAAVLNAGFIFIYLMPETWPTPSEDKPMWQYLKSISQFYTAKTTYRPLYVVLLITWIIVGVATGGSSYRITLYYLNAPFCWSAKKIGILAGLLDLLQPIAGMTTLVALQRCFSDSIIGFLSVVVISGGYATLGVATTDWHLYLSGALRFPLFIFDGMLRSVLSKLTPPDKQGIALCSLTALEALTELLGRVSLNAVYAATVMWYAGTVFLIHAFLMGISGVGFLSLHFMMKRTDTVLYNSIPPNH